MHDPTTCRDGDHYGQCSGATPLPVRVELPPVRYTGRKIMTMIAEALGPDCADKTRLCESGCGCRYGTEDPDGRDCACDGPCCESTHDDWFHDGYRCPGLDCVTQ